MVILKGLIDVNDSMATRLNSMYLSGEVTGYLCAQLPKGDLKQGWITRGLLLKGIKGSLTSKANQLRFIDPMEQATSFLYERLKDAPDDWVSQVPSLL